jgi:hypothetical protein
MTTRVVNRRDKVPYDVYIGRPSKYGNPFSHLPNATADYRVASRDEAVDGYRSYILTKLAYEPDFLEPLRGKVLACWCRPRSGFEGRVMCHGQIIAGLLDDIPPEDVP